MSEIITRLSFSLAIALAVATSAGCVEDSEYSVGEGDDKADVFVKSADLRSYRRSESFGFHCEFAGGCIVLVTVRPDLDAGSTSPTGELVTVSVDDEETKSLWRRAPDGESNPAGSVTLDDEGYANFYLRARSDDQYLTFELPEGLDRLDLIFQIQTWSLVDPCPASAYL